MGPGATPDRGSRPKTTTSWRAGSNWFQPSGGVLSMFRTMLATATLPAMSVALPVITCPAPSVVTVTGMLNAATPDSVSTASKLTVTSVLLQPLAFGGGLATTTSVGGVLSILIVRVLAASVLLPLSRAKQLRVVIPSALIAIEAELPWTVVSAIGWAP